MRKTRFFSLVLAVLIAISMIPASISVSAADDTALPGAPEGELANNLIAGGSFDSASCLTSWRSNNQRLEQITASDGKGGYLQMSKMLGAAYGFRYNYNGTTTIGNGIYHVVCWFRTVYEGEVTELRFALNYKSGKENTVRVYPTSDKWLKVDYYVELGDDSLVSINVCGGPWNEFIQVYALDNLSVVKVEEIPEGAKVVGQYDAYHHPNFWGTPVTPEQAVAANNGSMAVHPKWDDEIEAQYKVEGLVMNRDIDIMGSFANGTTEAELKKYCYDHVGSHVTDFMINIFCNTASYPSEVSNDFVDGYYRAVENETAITANERAAYLCYEILGIDYIDIWCETFPEVGINPWLSYRMNDAHGSGYQNQGSYTLHERDPMKYRRVQRPDLNIAPGMYYNALLDYTHQDVRDYFIELINEGLSKYDCYGIELDWQRDIYLWYPGGEYNGLDILNDFMRDLNDLIKIYEEKYGHEIKVAARVSSDIQNNYDLGLDVITWAAEGLIDLVNPTTRWATTNFDIPTRTWVSLMHPHGVEVAPGMECNLTAINQSASAVINLQEMVAFSVSAFTQGADKVYAYNYFRSPGGFDPKEMRVSAATTMLYRTANDGYWNNISTIGSLEKSLTVNRRMLTTYEDVYPAWGKEGFDFPKAAAAGEHLTFRVPVGEIPMDAKVTLKFSVNNLNIAVPPTVLVNGVPVEFVGTGTAEGNLTTRTLLFYNVPKEVYDDVYFVVEASGVKYLSVDHAEVAINVLED